MRRRAYRTWFKCGVEVAREDYRCLYMVLKRMGRRENLRVKWEIDETLLREPLRERAKAMRQYKMNKRRWRKMGKREGKQVTPSSFTQHLGQAHEQWRYFLILPRRIKVPADFEARVRKVIIKGGNIKEVRTDGIHAEILRAEPDACEAILKAWWRVVG